MTHARAGQNLKRRHGWLLFFFAIAACERGNGAAMTVIQARETRLTTVADERIYQATYVLFVACARHPPHLAIAGWWPRQCWSVAASTSRLGLLKLGERQP